MISHPLHMLASLNQEILRLKLLTFKREKSKFFIKASRTYPLGFHTKIRGIFLLILPLKLSKVLWKSTKEIFFQAQLKRKIRVIIKNSIIRTIQPCIIVTFLSNRLQILDRWLRQHTFLILSKWQKMILNDAYLIYTYINMTTINSQEAPAIMSFQSQIWSSKYE